MLFRSGSGCIALLMGRLIELKRPRQVNLRTIAVLIALTQKLLGPGEPGLRRLGKPGKRLIVILFRADAPVVAESQIALGSGITSICGLAVERYRPGRVGLHADARLIAQPQRTGAGSMSVFMRLLVELESSLGILFYPIAVLVALAQKLLGPGDAFQLFHIAAVTGLPVIDTEK